jgi:hypothetical protein
MLRIPKGRPALPLTFGAKIGLSFYLSAAGVQSVPWDWIQGHSRFFGFGDELRILQRFKKSRFHGAHAIAWHAWRHIVE